MFTTDEKRKHYPKQQKHKFDKQLINVNTTTTASTQNTSIFTATYPCVIMGLLVSGCSLTLLNAAVTFQWFVLIVEQGTAPSAPAFSGSAYAPEQQVMAFGSGVADAGGIPQFIVKTKTGRKMRVGDQLYFIVTSLTANLISHCYTIQFFLKI